MDMENGSQDNTTMILVVGVCFSCMLCIGALAFAYYQGWLDNIIDWFKGEDEEETTPTTEEGGGPTEEGGGPTEVGGGTKEEDDKVTSSSCVDNPDNPCPNKSGKRHVCPAPWTRKHVKYSTNGKGARCCKDLPK